MNVIQFPRPEGEPELIALAPQGYVRRDPWMGLTETIAWVASRDKRLSDAAYWFLHEREARRADDTFSLWYVLSDDLLTHYGADLGAAEAEVMTAGLEAIGRDQGDGFEPINPLMWVDVKLAFDEMPDSIRPKSLRDSALGKPRWSHIRFKRSDVLARWGAVAQAVEEEEEEEEGQTRPRKSNREQPWCPMLRTEFEREHQKRLAWPEKHPDDLPPSFPTNASFKRRLVARGWKESDIKRTTLDYHCKALRDEFGW